MTNTTAVGRFVEELAIHIESLVLSPMLVRGQNLFQEKFFEDDASDDAAVDKDHISLFDQGYTENEKRFSYRMLDWIVLIATARDDRDSAAEALRPIVNKLVEDRVFSTTMFNVKSVRADTAPQFSDQLENGRFVASASVLFQVVPL